MAKIDLVMPKMGESIMEATILKWVKKVGDSVEEDETILEIATDKVDSEIPSPIDGVISEILFKEDDVVEVGKVIAIISTQGEPTNDNQEEKLEVAQTTVTATKAQPETKPNAVKIQTPIKISSNGNGQPAKATSTRFYSPLVKSIAKAEKITLDELGAIAGSGANGRVTKSDIILYVENRSSGSYQSTAKSVPSSLSNSGASDQKSVGSQTSISGGQEIIEMDRMRKMIADHMVMSKRTSPHVTSFVEADVTNLANWREANKKSFQEKYGEKITYTPIFIEAVVKALKDYPLVNVSVDGDKIIVKKDFNIGMATALPSGNLIVPVIKNADYLNLAGLTKKVNDLAGRARTNKLKPDEVQGGTFTVTNVGTFGNVMGTPIINQPQVAILALGAIRKKPAVLETKDGDVIAIRKMMFMSLSYDHRVVDGFLGGSFLRKIGDYLEAFDSNQTI